MSFLSGLLRHIAFEDQILSVEGKKTELLQPWKAYKSLVSYKQKPQQCHDNSYLSELWKVQTFEKQVD